MRLLAALITLLCASSGWAVTVSGQSSPVSAATISVQFPAGDTADSDPISVGGVCYVRYTQAGGDDVSLYAVTTASAAATSGTLLRQFTASTTSAYKFYPGTFYVKAKADTADTGGSVLVLDCAPRGGSAGGLSSSAAAPAAVAGNPWISCSGLPDPGYTPVSVTTADDLHQVVIDECATGCTLELAPGDYTDTNVTMGPEASDDLVKAGSLDEATGEIIIRAANPADPPVLYAEPGVPAAVFYIVDIEARMRFENLILDGMRSEQTNDIFINKDGASTICEDDDENGGAGDGICDTGTLTMSEAGGINVRARTSIEPRVCVDNVTVRNTIWDAFFIRNAVASTVENSTVEHVGCTDSTCPLLDIPYNAENNNLLTVARGVNLVDSDFVAGYNNRVTDATKIGAQCFGSTQCYLAENVLTDIGNGGLTMLGSSGYVWRNTINGVGTLYGQNSTDTNTGSGIDFVDETDYTGDLSVEIIGNTVSDTFGSSINVGLRKVPAAESSTLIIEDNVTSNACTVSTLAANAGILIGDGTDRLESITLNRNSVSDSLCTAGIRVRNVIDYAAENNTVTNSGSTAVLYDDVEALDEDGLEVDGAISIDADSVGTLTNCTLNGGATITGALEGGVTRTNCGPAQTGGSSNWGELEWDADDWG